MWLSGVGVDLDRFLKSSRHRVVMVGISGFGGVVVTIDTVGVIGEGHKVMFKRV